ncbi:MAG TPA: M48 family metalloprotease [Kiritimatiellia bacterium]|nr:M48 family metalloprotease [Kiritimatiellia bacterium]
MKRSMNRRDFIALTAAATAGGLSVGCATNPVTGKRQFMLLSEGDEIALDREHAPHQLSADFGVTGDPALNAYIQQVGLSMTPHTQRPHMPYSFQVVNAPYFNAYTFPAGTVAATRGIMIGLENEAQLAALLGHELGHVNARHAAQRMSKGMMAQLTLVVVGAALSTQEKYAEYAPLAAGLGMVGAGALLAYYSREDEREADALGMDYAVAAGYASSGMVGLMNQLRQLERRRPNAIERMFASHPMSDERYRNAQRYAASRHAAAADLPEHRERYMDATAGLRAISGAIESLQRGQEEMQRKRPQRAYDHYRNALAIAPDDYAGLLMLAECYQAMNKPDEARRVAARARDVNPREPQAVFVLGMAELNRGRADAAHQNFQLYNRMLPGNPNVTFWNGFALEGMGRKDAAAREYKRFLNSTTAGSSAQHAFQRLSDWGHIRPAP